MVDYTYGSRVNPESTESVERLLIGHVGEQLPLVPFVQFSQQFGRSDHAFNIQPGRTGDNPYRNDPKRFVNSISFQKDLESRKTAQD